MGKRVRSEYFSLYGLQRDVLDRVGIVCSRKVGGAVVRNRLRRRMRAILREILVKGWVRCDLAIVFSGRATTLRYRELRDQFLAAFTTIQEKLTNA